MNKLFKDIRHSDIEAVRAAILKAPAVVNEVYCAKNNNIDIMIPIRNALKEYFG